MSGKPSLPSTELIEVAISGDNMLFVKRSEAFQVGNQITITGTGFSGHKERAVVKAIDGNEIMLDSQLGFSYRPGAEVAVEAIKVTEALTDAPTPSPTAVPTESPTAAPTEAPLTDPPTGTSLTDTTTSKTTTTYTTTTLTATSITTVF
ncbi:unnamed protein product [Prorocentrum cordatum]|uniref:Uncharacterized protein n=1 Tax=Prorocentrum cordatum TaxID=2364126 RepID=A0ABN9WLE4_9DINO|nr:unnamed protein product [Polarella glacialis]